MNAGGVRRLGRDPVEIPLSLASMDIWQSLQDHIGDHVDAFHPCFYLKVALDEDGQALGVDRIDALQKVGFQHEIWLEDRKSSAGFRICPARHMAVFWLKGMAGRCRGA